MVDRNHDYILRFIEKDLSVAAIVNGLTQSNCKMIALQSIVSVIVVDGTGKVFQQINVMS